MRKRFQSGTFQKLIDQMIIFRRILSFCWCKRSNLFIFHWSRGGLIQCRTWNGMLSKKNFSMIFIPISTDMQSRSYWNLLLICVRKVIPPWDNQESIHHRKFLHPVSYTSYSHKSNCGFQEVPQIFSMIYIPIFTDMRSRIYWNLLLICVKKAIAIVR